MIFLNRKHAGEMLAENLKKYAKTDCVVLALPRGGVPVGIEISTALDAPMDVLVVRKIGAPFQTELALGALCEDAAPLWNKHLLARVGLNPDDLKNTVKSEINRIWQQIEIFRGGRRLPSLEKKNVIVVDDGLATGATIAAAIKYLKKKGAAKIIIAVPVAAAESVRKLRMQVDEFVVIEETEELSSVGEWYKDFTQISDEEVLFQLASVKRHEVGKVEFKEILIPVDHVQLEGSLVTVPGMKALIVFAHGSGSSRKSPRNQQVATQLNRAGFGTLLFDLLLDEEAEDRRNVFDINFLGRRLALVSQWLRRQPEFENTPLGYFGASTGAGAAIKAASQLPEKTIYAIVSRGGRPDLAGAALDQVKAPTLLLVGSRDHDVIELNREAQRKLSYAKLSIIPGATHLFEESGTLEEVASQAVRWFSDHLKPKMLGFKTPKTAKTVGLEDAIESGLNNVQDENDLDALIQSIKDHRVVMLGESSHGTEEFYQLRRLISQRLIRDHGFKFIAVEGDWPDANRLHRYIEGGLGDSARKVLLQNHRWPTWMWANEEIVKLAEWMKLHPAGFYGLDVYSLFDSMEEVVRYLQKNQPDLAQEVKRRYACFDPYEGDEISYARSLIEYPPGCESEVLENLQKLLSIRVSDITQNGNDLFSTQQNARIVANAESYYRAMLSGDASSWNLRDSHMMETLDRLLERYGEGAKAIVWAHNTHIGDYRATDMKDDGYVNLGGLARQSYGEANVALVGFGTYQGEVLAGAAWGRPEQVMPLPAAQVGSYESHFHNVAKKYNLEKYYVLLEHDSDSPWAQRLGHRAVGVVYDPLHERRGNYVPTELSKRYDAFFFVDNTHALKSLHAVFVHGEFPETWPSGE